MFPEIFHIGGFHLYTYGVLLALAFLSALLIAARLAVRDGLPRERVYDLGLWVLLAALAGSKFLMIFTEYRGDLRQLFSLDFLRSGGVFYGGFIGAVVAGYFLIRRYKLPWWKTADAFAPGIALGNAIGRLGCFAAGCCWGKETAMPWGVKFTEAGNAVTGVPFDRYIHPTQLYESFGALVIFGFLFWLHRRKRFNGQIILGYAVLYSVMRFTIEIFRDDPRGDISGLTTLTGLSTSQMLSLLVGTTALLILILRWRRASDGRSEKISPAPKAARA